MLGIESPTKDYMYVGKPILFAQRMPIKRKGDVGPSDVIQMISSCNRDAGTREEALRARGSHSNHTSQKTKGAPSKNINKMKGHDDGWALLFFFARSCEGDAALLFCHQMRIQDSQQQQNSSHRRGVRLSEASTIVAKWLNALGNAKLFLARFWEKHQFLAISIGPSARNVQYPRILIEKILHVSQTEAPSEGNRPAEGQNNQCSGRKQRRRVGGGAKNTGLSWNVTTRCVFDVASRRIALYWMTLNSWRKENRQRGLGTSA